MSDTRISAADLLRLAAIASVSPEGTADEVVAILQRTGPAEPAAADHAPQPEPEPDAPAERAADEADSDKLAKPE
ncbi:hypothetical protein LPC10_01635 [Methylorubrum sp. B1-46]|uniref:hypothetical protein n=1 Tax=Methylorubrum sp. B1-46 TaxID=2897334 RepID=UPI001E6350BD|nr:hypothetical protein [Methylorubrum sp. B1-46]UGB26342.1 hypothetical protein LPC10_01635 [Methylorubrum sp. B1-46]